MTSNSGKSRFVDVFELARTGGEATGSISLSAMPRLSSALARSDGALDYRLQGRIDARGRPVCRLTFTGSAMLGCDRCGEPVSIKLAGEGHYYFVRSEDELARIPVDEDADEPLLGSARFDVHALVEDDAILALPIAPRHDVCAAVALPAGEAATAGESDRVHPFAALAKLRPRRH